MERPRLEESRHRLVQGARFTGGAHGTARVEQWRAGERDLRLEEKLYDYATSAAPAVWAVDREDRT